MANYISFRDVSSVLGAGNKLATAGGTLESAVTSTATPLKQPTAFKRRDGYGQDFWNDNYAAMLPGAKAPRHEELVQQGTEWAVAAKDMGADVVTATTTILWQDAIAGAELASARNR